MTLAVAGFAKESVQAGQMVEVDLPDETMIYLVSQYLGPDGQPPERIETAFVPWFLFIVLSLAMFWVGFLVALWKAVPC